MSVEEFDPLDHETPQADKLALRDLVTGFADKLVFRMPRVLEVGSWVGGTAIVMADAGARVYCVEHLTGNAADRLGAVAGMHGKDKVLATFIKNVGDRLFRTIHPCIGSSFLWGKAWPDSVTLDMVFLDADHRYEFVRQDINLWWPKLRKGGVMVGHDYGIFQGVDKAADEKAAELGVTVTRLGHCLWLLKKE